LRAADDAVVIDSDHMNANEVFEKVKSLCND
jgi:cytidylate kinase